MWADNVVAKEQREHDLKIMREDHQLLALKVLFTEKQVAHIQSNRACTFSAEQLTRIGIVQVSHEGKLHFIHRTFAENYVADYLVNRLNDGNNSSQEVHTFILKVLLQEAECRVIRVFINAFWSRSQPLDEVINHYGSLIYSLGTDRVRILFNIAVEGDANIIGFLLNCLLEATDRISFIQLWESEIYGLSDDTSGNTVCDDISVETIWKAYYENYLYLRWDVERNRTAKNKRKVCFNCTGCRKETVWEETAE